MSGFNGGGPSRDKRPRANGPSQRARDNVTVRSADRSPAQGKHTQGSGKRRSSGERRAWVPHGEESSFELAGVIRAEAFAAARKQELVAASEALPPLVPSSADALIRIGAPPARMRLRRRAASFRPYSMPLSVRLNPRKKRKVLTGSGAIVMCRAARRAVRRLALRQHTHSAPGPDPRWLATHLWHTKRMKMGNFYGHRVALSRADAGERAAVRWARRDATIYDESYCACLQLSGTETDLKRLFSEVAPGSAALSADCCAGGHENEIMVYCSSNGKAEHAAPRSALAPARILWQPSTADALEDLGVGARRVWLWVHPAASEQLQSELTTVTQAHSLGIKCVDVGVEMARFQLRGPLSQEMVSAVLRICASEEPLYSRKEQIWKTMCEHGPAACVGSGDAIMISCSDPRTVSPLPQRLLRTRSNDPGGTSTHSEEQPMGQRRGWRDAIGTGVRDPGQGGGPGSGHDELLCQGPLWSAVGRKQAILSDRELHARRHRGLVTSAPTPGGASADTAARARLGCFPALLVRVEDQRRHAKAWGQRGQDEMHRGGKAGAACGVAGWDVVLPRNWALVVWLALVRSGCRALALRESMAVEMERGALCFPRDYPDTAAFSAWAQIAFDEQRRRSVLS